MGYRLWVIGYGLMVTGYRLLVMGYRLLVNGYRLLVNGYRLGVIVCRLEGQYLTVNRSRLTALEFTVFSLFILH